MVERESKEQPRSQYSNLEFRLQDASSMQVTGEFDVIFSNATLHWIKNHASLLYRIARSLKPVGMFLPQMGGKGNTAVIIGAIGSLIDGAAWHLYFEGFAFPYSFHGVDEYAVCCPRIWCKTA